MADQPEPELTTVQIKTTVKEKLRQLAAANYRSMTAQLEFMIERDYKNDVQPVEEKPQTA